MPNVTLYVRQDDLEKWKLIENKTELVSQAINRSVITPTKNKETPLHHEIARPSDDEADPYCEHGFLIGKCDKC